MASRVNRHGETEAHLRLKRLALIWAQSNGYRACATEVTLPRSRYRADVIAYRPPGVCAVFECKQSRSDLQRDNCCSATAQERLLELEHRRAILERCLRVHYPTLRTGGSLFPEFDTYDFDAIQHRGYARATREIAALRTSLVARTKFEKLTRYSYANVYYLVTTRELRCEVSDSWGVLVEADDSLETARKPVWHDTTPEAQLAFLEKLAAVATREANRKFGVDTDLLFRH
ncbi:MAG: hypothetical protein ACJ8IQ_01580 [Chthoniobacterales bacterium]